MTNRRPQSLTGFFADSSDWLLRIKYYEFLNRICRRGRIKNFRNETTKEIKPKT